MNTTDYSPVLLTSFRRAIKAALEPSTFLRRAKLAQILDQSLNIDPNPHCWNCALLVRVHCSNRKWNFMHDIPRFRDFVEGTRRPNFIYIRNDEVYGSFFQKLLSEEKNSSYQRMPLLRQHHLQKTVWYHDSASISRLVKPYLSDASIKSIPLSFHSPAVMLPTYMYRNRRRNTLG